MHPRLGRMLLQAKRWGVEPLACDLAALLSERDVSEFRNLGADLNQRLNRSERPGTDGGDGLGTLRQQSRQWLRQLQQLDMEIKGVPLDDPLDLAMARLIATAFPSGWPWHDQDASVPLCSSRGVVLCFRRPIRSAPLKHWPWPNSTSRTAMRIRIAVPLASTLPGHGRGGWRVEGTGDLG